MSDDGTIVLGWLTRLVAVFAVLGLLAYDGVSVLVATVGAADDAGTAASAAADTYQSTHDVQKAYQAAVQAVPSQDAIDPADFAVAPGGKVTLTVERTPTTLWLQHVGPLKKWTTVAQGGSGTPAS